MKALCILFVPLLVLFAGCSENKSSKVNEEASFSGMVNNQAKAIEKAKALEQQLQGAERKRFEQLGQ